MRYALIRKGVVENVIEWDGVPFPGFPPRYYTLFETDEAGAGDSYKNAVFTRAEVVPPPVPEKSALELRVEALEAKANV